MVLEVFLDEYGVHTIGSVAYPPRDVTPLVHDISVHRSIDAVSRLQTVATCRLVIDLLADSALLDHFVTGVKIWVCHILQGELELVFTGYLRWSTALNERFGEFHFGGLPEFFDYHTSLGVVRSASTSGLLRRLFDNYSNALPLPSQAPAGGLYGRVGGGLASTVAADLLVGPPAPAVGFTGSDKEFDYFDSAVLRFDRENSTLSAFLRLLTAGGAGWFFERYDDSSVQGQLRFIGDSFISDGPAVVHEVSSLGVGYELNINQYGAAYVSGYYPERVQLDDHEVWSARFGLVIPVGSTEYELSVVGAGGYPYLFLTAPRVIYDAVAGLSISVDVDVDVLRFRYLNSTGSPVRLSAISVRADVISIVGIKSRRRFTGVRPGRTLSFYTPALSDSDLDALLDYNVKVYGAGDGNIISLVYQDNDVVGYRYDLMDGVKFIGDLAGMFSDYYVSSIGHEYSNGGTRVRVGLTPLIFDGGL